LRGYVGTGIPADWMSFVAARSLWGERVAGWDVGSCGWHYTRSVWPCSLVANPGDVTPALDAAVHSTAVKTT
jgi:hypothetical protein